MITREDILNHFFVDTEKGELRWKNNQRKPFLNGELAGYNCMGYYRINFLGIKIYRAKLIWLVAYEEWAKGTIDHINRVRSDDRLLNLRTVTWAENRVNANLNSNSLTGVKGVSIQNNRYRASIRINGINHNLGTYDTLEEANTMRTEVAKEIWGEDFIQ